MTIQITATQYLNLALGVPNAVADSTHTARRALVHHAAGFDIVAGYFTTAARIVGEVPTNVLAALTAALQAGSLDDVLAGCEDRTATIDLVIGAAGNQYIDNTNVATPLIAGALNRLHDFAQANPFINITR